MKKAFVFIFAAVFVSCSSKINPGPGSDPEVKNPITISSPTPTQQISKVSLDDTQKGYVKAGNSMAFRFLSQMYDGSDLILSPLSLQYALAMAANGASGETLQEIIGFLGYGSDGIDALNAYCKTLLEQLPAVDLDVKLKLTDALLVNDLFPLLPSFLESVRGNYYAAVENMDFGNPALVAARINEWASRSTDGFIDKVLSPDEISEDAVAFIMNALYFKASWEGSKYNPMFRESDTQKESFTKSDGSKVIIQMMNDKRRHQYAEMDGYKVLALPYAGGKFFMYILLPDKNDLSGLVKKLTSVAWSDVLASFKSDADVYLKLPKFDIEDKYYLKEPLQALGVNRAFVAGEAQFSKMFLPKEQHYDYWIGKVIQKAKISVAEWGTEAAAVTVVEMDGATSVGPGAEPKRVYFYADHPFVFLIGEATSGTILFEGTYTGK